MMKARSPSEPLFHTLRGVLVSFAFWMCLFIAAACFGAVALSPKYLQHQRLTDELTSNHQQLVALERQTLQLKEVVDALQNDPAFAEELARVEFDAVRPGEEVLPVDEDLRLDPRRTDTLTESEPAPAEEPDPLHSQIHGILLLTAHARDVRTGLLLAAATLVIVAFTWLQEPSVSRIH